MVTDTRLSTVVQLHKNATVCVRLAEEARTSAHRLFFIEMAERWLTLAELAEKGRYDPT
jgi:hypothetical protein